MRRRRDFDPQRSHLPDRVSDLLRASRSGLAARPLGGKHEPVLRLAQQEEEFAHSPSVMDSGSLFDWRQMRMRRKQRFCSTSSMSSAIWRSLGCVRKSEYASSQAASALHQVRNTRCCRAREPEPGSRKALKTLLAPTSDLTRLVLKESFASCGAMNARMHALLRELRASLKCSAQALRKICRDDRSSLDSIAAYCRWRTSLARICRGSTTRSA